MRNTFGMDFDPVTGILWDSENGPTYGDEINIVNPGFNSGGVKIMGLAKDDLTGDRADPAKDLVDFNGKGKYRDPEFVWTTPIGVTALKFLNSDKLGQQYQNTIFIGDVDTGFLYNFKPNEQRTGLLLDDPLSDKVADNPNEMLKGGIVFGKGFGVITDIQVGPDNDGYLYILNLQGSIYRISPSSSS
jgi:glucose/arabinose dehydrogenase